MARMSLFSRKEELPGLSAPIRDLSRATRASKAVQKVAAGDIVVIAEPNISRGTAQLLVDLEPAAVVNTAQFSTGSVPLFGPQMLLDAGITLVEDAGVDVLEHLRDGKTARLTDSGELFHGETLLGSGRVLTQAGVEFDFSEAERNLVERAEAYFGNTVEFLRSEAPLLIDGLGVPETGLDATGEAALVIAPGPEQGRVLKDLRGFIKARSPMIVAIDEAADLVVEQGYTPDVALGDPTRIQAATLRAARRVVLPAAPDGHAAGLERIQDLGVGAMTFPAATESTTDLGLLLAHFHGADLIVNVSEPLTLDAIIGERAGLGEPLQSPAALLTRLRVADKLVGVAAAAEIGTRREGAGGAWLLAILGVLAAIVSVVLVAGFGGGDGFAENLEQTFGNLV